MEATVEMKIFTESSDADYPLGSSPGDKERQQGMKTWGGKQGKDVWKLSA